MKPALLLPFLLIVLLVTRVIIYRQKTGSSSVTGLISLTHHKNVTQALAKK